MLNLPDLHLLKLIDPFRRLLYIGMVKILALWNSLCLYIVLHCEYQLVEIVFACFYFQSPI